MSTALGRIPIAQYYIDSSSTNITASGGSTVQLDSALSGDVEGIEIVNDLGAPVILYAGPAGSETALMIIPGIASTVIHQQRQAIALSKGMRLSVRAYANTAISSGTLTINLWQ